MESTERTDGSERASHLLKRLDAIGASLAETDTALALIGLGSVGVEMERLDDYSDLDFFAVVRPGYKERFIVDLSWLERVHPLVYSFQNTVDGHKALFADNIYVEFAVFIPDELAHIPAPDGRVVWQARGFDASALHTRPPTAPEPRTVEWLVGEMVTNLYVGLCRLRRGEKLSATRLIQGHAIDRLIELSPLVDTPTPALADGFAPERRYEQRFPEVAASLPAFMQGYDHNVESALALLSWVEQRFPVNEAIRRRILELCATEDDGAAHVR